MTEKRCTACFRWLPLDGFDRDQRKGLRFGRRNDCKQCRKDRRNPRPPRDHKAVYARRKAAFEQWKGRALRAEEELRVIQKERAKAAWLDRYRGAVQDGLEWYIHGEQTPEASSWVDELVALYESNAKAKESAA